MHDSPPMFDYTPTMRVQQFAITSFSILAFLGTMLLSWRTLMAATACVGPLGQQVRIGRGCVRGPVLEQEEIGTRGKRQRQGHLAECAVADPKLHPSNPPLYPWPCRWWLHCWQCGWQPLWPPPACDQLLALCHS